MYDFFNRHNMPFFPLSTSTEVRDATSPVCHSHQQLFLLSSVSALLCLPLMDWDPANYQAQKLYLSCPQLYGTHGEWKIMILPKLLPLFSPVCARLVNILYISLVSHSQGYLITSSASLNTVLIHQSHKAKADIWSFLSSSLSFFIVHHASL